MISYKLKQIMNDYTFYSQSIPIWCIWRCIPRCRNMDEGNSMLRRITTLMVLEQNVSMELRFRVSSEKEKKLLLIGYSFCKIMLSFT